MTAFVTASGWLASAPDLAVAAFGGELAPAVLAQNNFGDTRSGGLAGPLGLFIIVLLAIATVLLIRNMNARLKRLPERFPPPPGPPGTADSRAKDSASSASEKTAPTTANREAAADEGQRDSEKPGTP